MKVKLCCDQQRFGCVVHLCLLFVVYVAQAMKGYLNQSVVVCTAACTFLLAFQLISASHVFVAGPSGAHFGLSPVDGYVLATLDDIASSDFLNVYNALGLHVSTPSFVFPSVHCPFIAVQGGYVGVGSPLDVVPTILAPFNSAQALQSGATLAAPVWFGVAMSTNFEGVNEYVGALNKTFLHSLYLVSPETLNGLSLTCSPSVAHVGLYREAVYTVAAYGADFPNPPSSSSQLLSLGDMQSDTFLFSYNTHGLGVVSSESVANVCCGLRVAGGYLALSSSSMAPYGGSETIQCPQSTLTAPVWLGTANDGGYPSAFIGVLNASSLSMLSVSTSQPSVCSPSSRNVWALYKMHPGATPTPPSPSGNCYNVEIQVSYYLPGGTVCLAERWSYYMQLNKTYSAVSMSSINECGGTVGSVSAFDMELQPYNDSYLVGRTSGATNCDCSGVTNWGFVPLNESGYTQMSTICNLPIQVYYFCDVLMYLHNGPVQCPPSP